MTYLRPDLINANPVELGEYLRVNGVTSAITLTADGLLIETDIDADALMSAFVSTTTRDEEFVAPVPASAPVATHLQHLKDFRNTVRSGGPAPTLAQTQHVLADVIDALRLLDARLSRDI